MTFSRIITYVQHDYFKLINFSHFLFFTLCTSTSYAQCNAPCNGKGTRYRTISCVWYGTKKPAGNACNKQPRPAVMKPCSGQTCVVNREYSTGLFRCDIFANCLVTFL